MGCCSNFPFPILILGCLSQSKSWYLCIRVPACTWVLIALSSQGGIDLSALNAGLYILELNGIRYRVIIE
ncbi:MAG: T9SS type A sorting domain-containing protein [Cytophagales bacterium]|nr:T9SS type A sorting domain-containing protein [Cytophagales bacterium]